MFCGWKIPFLLCESMGTFHGGFLMLARSMLSREDVLVEKKISTGRAEASSNRTKLAREDFIVE